ncbi:hypothetical protein KR009_010449, partial [Drosophila setifemur]
VARVEMCWLLLILSFAFFGGRQVGAGFLEPNCGEMTQGGIINRNHQANIHESPWMAYLHASGTFLCGGSLITHRNYSTYLTNLELFNKYNLFPGFVLTAAHCIRDEENLRVRLGEFDSSTSTDCIGTDCLPPSEEFEVNLAIRNREYSHDNRRHDIGLLRLAQSVTYKSHIKPICLITDTSLKSRIELSTNFVATGWGGLQPGRPSHILKSMPVHRLNRKECRDRYLVDCYSDQICVGHASGEACSGDSGGPMGTLVRYADKVVFTQIGIVSYGNPECYSPSVFTDVMSHMDWIEMVVSRYSQ